ncbi:hypothetical protein CFOL_v3_01002 [Cephalotus follicularis]|uniref:Uncharacterized protein n=1 Tax=Cephalotus follicularis TaxID=3775 RepID=A0A1Q3APB5_CEPFO|nr:hypothetical protein CFOL_v3_01002 [Cephalotus follicularis]
MQRTGSYRHSKSTCTVCHDISESQPRKLYPQLVLEANLLEGLQFFHEASYGSIHYPETKLEPLESPPFRVMPGRPKRCRRNDPLEPKKQKIGKLSRNGRTMTCIDFGVSRHIKKGC